MKDIFSKLNEGTQAKDELDSILAELEVDIDKLKDFLEMFEDYDPKLIRPTEVIEVRKHLKHFSETFTVILNNLDMDSAIPQDTTGTAVTIGE